MKRFRLKTGHTIKVDDDDAYLFRSYVWWGVENDKEYNSISVFRGSSRFTSNMLTHYLVGERGKPYVVHLNGDTTDFQRANLKAMTEAEYGAWKGEKMRSKKRNSV